ncbi:hypothetical protein DM02DRAFT_217857 [Periconia macrospinosa]|uniref:Zn(2)-C6 fungal-type domain-containing protein n=1 Tax=Periconia macrospinosa TaxID=97972 RepID=A0A2V1DZV0_9PLEO|nr:hypothetical protein DM02DRAFT_217857 [Periconia macrospinosa]
MSTKSAESRENSPDGPEGSSEKRLSKKRKVLSCYACRSRKMKCDRVFPVCGRCQKTGRADQCTYDPRLIEEAPVNGDGHVESTPTFGPSDQTAITNLPTDTLQWRLRVQERRIQVLEKKLSSVENPKPNLSGVSVLQFHDSSLEEPQLGEEIMFRGKSFKTQFTGTTSHLSAAGQFPELQVFTRQALATDGSNMHRVRNDFKAFRERKKILRQEQQINFTNGPDDEIFRLLPEKTIVDQQMTKYFRSWETSYRILHEPTFWKDYQKFWERSSNDKFATIFAVILLYIGVITKCDTPNDMNVFVGDSSADRDDASNIVVSCDAWLALQPRKQFTLNFFQIHCLSVLAKRVNCLRLKQDWVNTGEVMRLALATGLHRNPSLIACGRISEYEKEMRRRLWVTIAELELQSSIDSGLQSSLCGLYFDAQPPANLPDDVFSPDMPQIPAGRPTEYFTSASYLSVTLKSLPLRVHLLQLLNNPTNNLRYSDVLHYDSQIASLLSSIPTWEDPRSLIASSLLSLQLRQFLLILHRPYARLAAKHQQYSYSLTVCVDASSALIASYETLVSKGLLALNHARNDILRAGITLSQAVYYNCTLHTNPSPKSESPGSNQPLHPMDIGTAAMGKVPFQSKIEVKVANLPKHNHFARILCVTALELLEKVRELFEAKLLRLGTGYVEYWLLCAAIAFMPPPNPTSAPEASSPEHTAEDLRARCRNAMERVVSLCFRILALQKDPQNGFSTALRTLALTPSPSAPTPAAAMSYVSGDSSSISPNIPGPSGMAAALTDEQNLGVFLNNLQDMPFDPSGWEFTNFWDFDMDGIY